MRAVKVAQMSWSLCTTHDQYPLVANHQCANQVKAVVGGFLLSVKQIVQEMACSSSRFARLPSIGQLPNPKCLQPCRRPLYKEVRTKANAAYTHIRTHTSRDPRTCAARQLGSKYHSHAYSDPNVTAKAERIASPTILWICFSCARVASKKK